MTVTDQHLASNGIHGASASGLLPLPPARHVSCTDARLDAARAQGTQEVAV